MSVGCTLLLSYPGLVSLIVHRIYSARPPAIKPFTFQSPTRAGSSEATRRGPKYCRTADLRDVASACIAYQWWTWAPSRRSFPLSVGISDGACGSSVCQVNCALGSSCCTMAGHPCSWFSQFMMYRYCLHPPRYAPGDRLRPEASVKHRGVDVLHSRPSVRSCSEPVVVLVSAHDDVLEVVIAVDVTGIRRLSHRRGSGS